MKRVMQSLALVLTAFILFTVAQDHFMNREPLERSMEDPSGSSIPDMPYEDVPSLTVPESATESTSTPSTTSQAESSDYLISLDSDGRTIGEAGLPPGTEIAIVTSQEGDTVRFETCTVAFSMPSKTNGYYAVTAGHCGKKGQEVYAYPDGDTFNFTKKYGEVEYTSISNYDSGAGDWGVIKLRNSLTRPAEFSGIPNAVSYGEQPEGREMCKTGTTTNTTCGEKTREGVQVRMRPATGGDQVSGKLDQARVCSLPGDSGAPVYTSSGIVGVLSSTSASMDDIEDGQCTEDNLSHYVPVHDVLTQIKRLVPDVDVGELKR